MIELNHIIHGDCMDYMPLIPELKRDVFAIADPPYGIGENWNKQKTQQHYGKKYSYKNNIIPDSSYFKELFRISINQIIWGGNYFTEFLKPTNTWIFWDKERDVEKTFMSEGEMAWTSFNIPMRKIRIIWNGGKKGPETGIKTIHPHQKPVLLYRWLLQNYAKPGDLILDTHSGSGSLACACHLEKFDFLAIEKDKDYFEASVKRLEEIRSQGVLF